MPDTDVHNAVIAWARHKQEVKSKHMERLQALRNALAMHQREGVTMGLQISNMLQPSEMPSHLSCAGTAGEVCGLRQYLKAWLC